MPDPIEGARCPGCGKLVHDGSCVRHNDSNPTRPCISFPPIDCSDNCSNGPCDCSGVWRDGCGRADEVAALRAELERMRPVVDELRFAVRGALDFRRACMNDHDCNGSRCGSCWWCRGKMATDAG